ncbi:MAG: fatty acid desaturase [Ferrovum sp.]|nr:fatty acid desaturase [Ferrovum sp.]NDU87252.1 fatty acid desaturase [Ferrovum sp.]
MVENTPTLETPLIPIIAPESPFPGRKTVRSWLIPLCGKRTLLPVAMIAFDFLLFFSALWATVWFSSFWAKMGMGMVAGFVIGRLFILGHDACHQSLTPRRGLNRILGRLAFLPSLTPYSLWDIGHNLVHHGQTNLKGFDFVWAPFSVEEYQALSPTRQWLERLYRSGWAPGLYYFIEMWWLRMYFPAKTYMGARRSAFVWDGVLVTVFAALWMGGLALMAVNSHQSILLTELAGFVMPFVFWNFMIGFVVYAHHTHTSVAWYDNKVEWMRAQPFVTTTVHLIFRFNMGALMHHIMEHTAHHLDMGIPLYRLKEAQKFLETHLPGRIIIQNFSWAWYFKTAQLCKLYDFKEKCWLDFEGNATSRSLSTNA